MMKRVAAPLFGGLATSFLLELLVYPAVYAIWKWNFEMSGGGRRLSTSHPGDSRPLTRETCEKGS